MGIFCQHMGNNGKALCANWWEKISRYFIASWLQLQFAKMPGGAFCSWPWGAPVELGSNNPWEKFPSLTNDAEDRKFVWQMPAVGENDFCWGKDFGISPNWLKYDLVYEQPIGFVGLLCQKVHTGEVENQISRLFQCLFQWATWQICEIWIWILKICLTLWRINTVDTDGYKRGLVKLCEWVQVVKRGVKVFLFILISGISASYHNDQCQSYLAEVWYKRILL